MHCPCRRPQVVRLTSRKVDVGRFSRDNLMGPLTNSHARVWMRRAQSLSSIQLMDASGRVRKAVGACLHVWFWLMSRSSCKAAVLMLRAGTTAQRLNRRLRRKEAHLAPARETSGREECFLRPNARGGAGRARPSPWLRFNRRASRRVLVKWKILDRYWAASAKSDAGNQTAPTGSKAKNAGKHECIAQTRRFS